MNLEVSNAMFRCDKIGHNYAVAHASIDFDSEEHVVTLFCSKCGFVFTKQLPVIKEGPR